ncbi:V-type proton ATPase catalytic subunit A-like [Apium graveolens]|uniref:V-type proton ATPase catalytic subunit A-like n=1 Tax=Apium graveolens TaxID=4045 RepID=UPI003D7BD1E9
MVMWFPPQKNITWMPFTDDEAEMPADSRYPAYLTARLASFYECAGKVKFLDGPERNGSVTVVGVVSPPRGDFSDPCYICHIQHRSGIMGLRQKAAPEDMKSLYEKFNSYFVDIRIKAGEVLQKEDDLNEIIQI